MGCCSKRVRGYLRLRGGTTETITKTPLHANGRGNLIFRIQRSGEKSRLVLSRPENPRAREYTVVTHFDSTRCARSVVSFRIKLPQWAGAIRGCKTSFGQLGGRDPINRRNLFLRRDFSPTRAREPAQISSSLVRIQEASREAPMMLQSFRRLGRAKIPSIHQI